MKCAILAVALSGVTCHAQPDSIFRRPAPILRWDEGVPLGNGLLGVLVWGDGRTIRLSLDRADLWDTRRPEVMSTPEWTYATMIDLKNASKHAEHQRLFDVPYDTIPYPTKLPAGRLEITLPEQHTLTHFWMDPTRGEGTVLYRGEGGVSGVLQVGLHADEPVAVLSGYLRPLTLKLVPPAGVAKLGYAPAEQGEDDDEAWFVQRTIADGVYAAAACVGKVAGKSPKQPASHGVGVAVVHDADATKALERARSLAARAVEGHAAPGSLTQRRGSHRAAFDASSVTIPDPRVQAQYDLCKHLFIAGSKPGSPPLALQGVWTADEGGLPPWKGDYHNDLNTQMTYLAYHAAGLNDQGLAWLDFNWNLLGAYRAFARDFYALAPGALGIAPAVVPGVMTIDGKPMGGWGQHSLSPTHSAWVAQSFYLHWRYTMDREFLRSRARPFCESIGEAFLRLAPPDAQGHRRLPLSSSPEIYDNSYKAWLPANSNYDLAMLRFMLSACAEMAEADSDAPRAAAWRAALAQCEPFDMDPATGFTFARGLPYNESHRHFSHAMAIHPLGLVTVAGSDADRETIRATLSQLNTMGTSWWTGYSFSWAACMFARCGDADRALEYLTKYLAFTGPNGFHLNGDQSGGGLSNFTYRPFTLEGNFLAMQAVHEMLLQSWGEVGRGGSSVVRVFPATPNAWGDVSFRGLRGEGGFRVSADRRGGMTMRVEIIADVGGRLRIKNPFGAAKGQWSAEQVFAADGVFEFELRPGQRLVGLRR